jgi:hypothetical protein
MGQHTWFYKDKELREKQIELFEKYLDNFDSNETMLSPSEIDKIYFELAEVSLENETEYHNIFRTSKRREDNTYIDDVIQSKEECDRWLEENRDTITWEDEVKDYKLLNEFWDKYPNGVIDFG